MKLKALNKGMHIDRSLPVRGAWIEMVLVELPLCLVACRSPYGERGLKYPNNVQDILDNRRSPYGERGLKSES